VSRIAFLVSNEVLEHEAPSFDGFVPRYRHALSALRAQHDVVTVSTSNGDVVPHVVAARPELVVVAAYLDPTGFREITRRWRTVLCVEEQIPAAGVVEMLPLRRRLRARARLEMQRRTIQPPTGAVIINEAERAWAERLLPRTPIHVVPLVVDVDHWSQQAITPAVLPPSVMAFSIGAMTFDYNARSVADVAGALRKRGNEGPVIAVASALGLHAALQEAVDDGTVLFLGSCLEPSRRCSRPGLQAPL
jgi:hypothetical protein